MAALHMATRTIAHLKHFRMDPTYWKDQTVLNRIEYHLSLERRQHLEWCYGIDLIPDDQEDDKKNAYDPFNPDSSKKESDLTDKQQLAFSKAQHQSEITDSMFGIDPSTIQGHHLANTILGETPEEICAKIPETFTILHCENVIRSDLTSKSLRPQAKVKDDLEKLKTNILKGSVKPET